MTVDTEPLSEMQSIVTSLTGLKTTTEDLMTGQRERYWQAVGQPTPGRTMLQQGDIARFSTSGIAEDFQQTSRAVGPIYGMKRWEGRVLSVQQDLLTAELAPIDHDGPTLVADFPMHLLGPDEDVVEPGDLVYLTTRYVREGNYPTTTSSLRLSRLGKWTSEELDYARARAIVRRRQFEQLIS